jgi:hypothetical protein
MTVSAEKLYSSKQTRRSTDSNKPAAEKLYSSKQEENEAPLK